MYDALTSKTPTSAPFQARARARSLCFSLSVSVSVSLSLSQSMNHTHLQTHTEPLIVWLIIIHQQLQKLVRVMKTGKQRKWGIFQ